MNKYKFRLPYDYVKSGEVVGYVYADDEEQALLAQQLATEFSALGETQVLMEKIEGEKIESSLLASMILPAPVSAINLLQGRFTVRQPSGKLPWWQIAAAVFLFAWLGQLSIQIGSGWYFNYQANYKKINSRRHLKFSCL